ncbi:MAG: xylulose 5-phosphate 3-epimerase [Planctomycetota bacterium]
MLEQSPEPSQRRRSLRAARELRREQADKREAAEQRRLRLLAEGHRAQNAAFADWAAGYGPIQHTDEVQVGVHEMAQRLVSYGMLPDAEEVFTLLAAADRVACAGMWLVAHMTYANRVLTKGADLGSEDFKRDPQGHMGGSLNMVPAYVGYLTADALTGVTRSWLMGQGHCVAAIDAVNLLVGNTGPRHAERYSWDDEGLARFVQDFYSYELTPDGAPAAPLGSHVNAHTAGALMEGGYLGFAELQYVHMPLPGERLVVFLSDGAFEEQRGSDWVPRWWRSSDSGLVTPIMIANGRRIDQRTTVSQQGGVGWLLDHLRLHGFDPFRIDGRDPAAFVWAILSMEERLTSCATLSAEGSLEPPAPMRYAVAEAPKGFGFPGAGTNRAHNLPLSGNPAVDEEARSQFHAGARSLWVPPAMLAESVVRLDTHVEQRRPRERDHPLARRDIPELEFPELRWRVVGRAASPMRALDDAFIAIVEANPGLRPRVGNPDELRSNRLGGTLDRLKHRVTDPEPGLAEAVDGAVITALNEEAVVCAALGNKGGINLVATYEAFAPKMLGALRQELTFSRGQREADQPPGWLAVPVVATSHTWENGKNEQSHQDPSFSETLLGEMSDVSRVLFPPDANCATAALAACYGARGEIWCLTVPKRDVPARFDAAEAERLVLDGALLVHGNARAPLQLVGVGSYHLTEAVRAAERLEARGADVQVVALLEPGRYRDPRDAREAAVMAPRETRERLFPHDVDARVLLTHTRPEPLLGVLRPLDLGRTRTRCLGYINHGGTLDTFGMLFANRCTWAHAIAALTDMLGANVEEFLEAEEVDAVRGSGDPLVLRP